MASNSVITKAVTIASGASLSSALDIHDDVVTGVVIPSGWTAANVTFEGSVDNRTYYSLYEQDGTEVVITSAGQGYYNVELQAFLPVVFVRLRSGTKAAPVTQVDNRTLTVLLKEL